ncbi:MULTISPECIES: glycosyltransferase [Devosia]|uniref:Glycogen synthase n=1 Tax=Devosia equisanguinis TaxID=2490941 RepID=A0A447I905_9HYPH|nr:MULTISPECIES: glycosyltransferase [Devosia]ODT47473.1 MAG: hypothetical protein ABS74_14475 [Pelagibacterium sp. SCN 63-126]ODU86102.1 MAG: hypothetical protein ABT14_09905 [Pelagibacterium sp. SCN 63-17]OJX42819.1 MAG: hypothetical protein BGO80_15390 [Devosia sp. 63-57]VDS03996.1 Glycogen synthase [Devosia equisanguinis]
MNVLHVYKTYLPEDFTGVPRVIHALAEGMAEQGVRSQVLALGPGKTGTEIPIDHHTVHIAHRDLDIASTGMSFSALGLFRRLSKSADVVHYHFPWPFADLLHFSARPNCPTVVTYHSDIVKQKRLLAAYAPLRDRFLRDLDAVVATSPNYVQSSAVLKALDDVQVIPIGIPDVPEPQPDLVAQWRERVGQDFFLFVGALRYYKGLSFLADAAGKTQARIVVAGAGDSSEWPGLDRDNVSYVGPISDEDKIALLSLCRAFVFPSHLRSEAFGIALLEAARAGKAMISCEMGTGTTYINLDNVTGLTVPPADAMALAAAIDTLEAAPERAAAMGAAARQRYLSLFRAEMQTAAYLELYRQVGVGS